MTNLFFQEINRHEQESTPTANATAVVTVATAEPAQTVEQREPTVAVAETNAAKEVKLN